MVTLATVSPCKGSSGTEVLLEERLDLSIPTAVQQLQEEGFDVTDASVLLIVRDKPQVTLYPSGRMLVHTDDLGRARERAVQVLAALGLD